jgi:hypothetical protein
MTETEVTRTIIDKLRKMFIEFGQKRWILPTKIQIMTKKFHYCKICKKLKAYNDSIICKICE